MSNPTPDLPEAALREAWGQLQAEAARRQAEGEALRRAASHFAGDLAYLVGGPHDGEFMPVPPSCRLTFTRVCAGQTVCWLYELGPGRARVGSAEWPLMVYRGECDGEGRLTATA